MDDSVTLYNCDSRELPIEDESVDMVMTSPPYYRLRTYLAPDNQIGLESTLNDYVTSLVNVFNEVKRVLRPWGSLWLNLGDSYAASATGSVGNSSTMTGGQRTQNETANRPAKKDLPDGNLLGIPWRVAFALQDNGWMLRSDCIWSKASLIPSSVDGWRWERCRVKVKKESDGERTERGELGGMLAHSGYDVTVGAQFTPCLGCKKCTVNGNQGWVLKRGSWRPTRDFEYVFQFSKGDSYYGDREAVKQPVSEGTLKRVFQPNLANQHDSNRVPGKTNGPIKPVPNVSGRNLRTVWNGINAEPGKWPGHHASFPTALCVIPIKASTSEVGNCCNCGMPWVRMLEKGENVGDLGMVREIRTVDWKPSCRCDDCYPVPAVVLDPFVGTGSTLIAARELGRRSIGVDLSEDYMGICIERLNTPIKKPRRTKND